MLSTPQPARSVDAPAAPAPFPGSRWRVALLAAPLLAAACGGGAVEATETGPPRIYTTFYPTTWMAARLVGERAEVVCPLPPGADPIFWQPARDVLAAYQEADLIVLNGAELEKWVATASLPESRVVESARALDGELITYQTTTHSHGPTGEHTHEGIDGHTWVDPRNAQAQARAIHEALVTRYPELEDELLANRRALDAELEGLHERLEALQPVLSGARLLASHAAYEYLARRHGLTIRNFDLDPGAEIDDGELAEIAAALEGGTGPAVMLWESAPQAASVQSLEERLGVESVLFSPCEQPPAEGDYLTEMHAGLDRLEAALSGG